MKYRVKIEQIIDFDLNNESPLSIENIIEDHLKKDPPYVCIGGSGYIEIKKEHYYNNYRYETRHKIKIISITKGK